MPQAYKPSEYLGLLRKNNPGSYDHIGDKDLLNYAIQQRPALSGELDFSEDILPTENYDPTIVDHLKQTAFNLKSMGVEMPAAVIGTAAYMLRDPLVKKAVMNSSEEWREWGKKKTDEWIQSDLGVKGYLEWQKNNPMSLKNFWHGDMMLRGISSLAPSIATTVAGGGLVGGLFKIGGAGLKIIKGGKIAGRFLTAASMEGSSEYNEAMSYLVDEKGMSPSEANEIATASAGAYSLASGALEYFQVNRAMRVLGVADDTVKKLWTTRIANKLDEAKKGKGVKSLAAVGTDIVQNSIVQGLQEGAQQTTQLMIGNVYKKYNGDIDKAFDNFAKDLREASGDPDTKESFWSSAAATLLTGGIGGGGKVASVGRRALERIKRRNANSKVEEDAHNFREPEDIDLPKSDGAILGSALIGDIGITDPTQEEQDRINEVNLNKIEDNKAQLFEELSEDPSIINEINSELSADEWFNAVDPEQNEDSHFTKDEAEVIRQAKIAADSQVEAEVIQEAQEEVDADEFLSDVDRLQKISAPRAQETVDDEIAEAQKIDEPEIGVSQEDIDKYAAMNPNERQKELTRLKQGRVLNQKEIDALQKNVGQETEESLKILRDLELKKQQDKDKQELLEALIRKDEGQLNLFTKPIKDKPVKETTDEVLEKEDPKTAQVPVMITQKMRADLKNLGFTPADIKKMKPQEAWDNIKAGEKKEAPAKKASIDFLDKLDSKPSNKAQQDVLSAFNNIQDIVDKETRDPDLQRPKKGPKVKDNKKVASALEKRLKKQFPWVKAKALEKVFDEEGTEVAGRSFKNIVEWSKGKATLDTIPHEYAHIYVKLMKNHPVIQEGLQRFGGEEKLVQRIGEYYANRIQDKGMLARIKTWLRKFHIALKQFFGSALSDKQLSNLISEQFYQAEMPTVDLADIKEGIAYQKLNRKTELFVKRQIDEIYNNVNKNNASFEFSPVDAISTIKSKLPDNMKYIVDDWVAIKAKTDSRFVDMYAKSIEDSKREKDNPDQEVTVAMTDSAINRLGFSENLAAIEENEIDSSEDSLVKVGKAGLRAIGVRELSLKQLRNLHKDARNKNKSFDQWINDSIKRNTGVLKVKDDKARRLLKQFWISARSEGRVNSDSFEENMYQALQLELDHSETGVWEKGRQKVVTSIMDIKRNFYRIGSKFKSWFGGSSFKEMKSKQYTPEFIASHLDNISTLLKNTSILDRKNLYTRIKAEGSHVFGNYSKPYNNLSAQDYAYIEEAEIKRYERESKKGGPVKDRIVPVFTRGETSTFFAPVTKRIRDIASSPESIKAYWKEQQDNFFVKDIDSYIKQEGYDAETNIAVYEFLNEVYPGYLNDKGGWANILKRIKIPFTPAKRNADMKDSTALFIATNRLSFQYKDGNEISGMQQIGDDKKHIGDGNSITGQSFFDKLEESFGLDPDSGFAKTIIYDSKKGSSANNSHVLMIKHNQSKADVGMVFYDGNMPVAEVKEDGNIYYINESGKTTNNIIDMIMTEDERKISEGNPEVKDKNFEEVKGAFTISGKAVGLIKYAEGVKTKIKFAHQWLNYVPNEMHSLIKKAYASEGTPIIESLTNAFKNTENATAIKKIVKKLSEMHPDDMPSNLQSFVDLGAGKHPAVAKQLATIVVNKYLQPAIAMHNQNGTSMYMAPNYRSDLQEGEIAIGAKNGKHVVSEYKKSTGDKRSLYSDTGKLNTKMLEEINEWLAGRDFKALAFRHPLPHLAGAVYVRVKRLHPKTNVAELHHNTTFINLEGDYDGDAVYLHYPPDSIKPEFERFFNSEEYKSQVKGIDLGKYADLDAKKIDLADTSARYGIMEEMSLGDRAIGEIASTQAVFNSIKNAINNFTIQVTTPYGDEKGTISTYRIKPRTEGFKIGKETVDVDTYLRIYLQAAADNAKFLLLSDWNYTVSSLRKSLFDIYEVTPDFKEKKIGNFFEAIEKTSRNIDNVTNKLKQEGNWNFAKNEPVEDKKGVFFTAIAKSSMGHGMWKVFDQNIYKLHKIPYDLRSGSVISEGKGGNLTFEDYLSKSNLYNMYLKNRNEYLVNNFENLNHLDLNDKDRKKYKKYLKSIKLMGANLTGNVGTMEYLATQVDNISESYDFDGIDPLNEQESNLLQSNENAMLEMKEDMATAEESVSAEIPDFNIQLDKGLVEHHKGSLSGINIDRLSEEVNWTEIKGRTGQVLRLQAYYGDKGTDYTYSGRTYAPNNWTPTLRQIKSEVEKITGFTFNSVLVNKYRDGNDSVAWHSDNEPELGDNPIIASVSLGATRTFKLQRKKPGVSGYMPEQRFGRQLEFKLENGDLFLMHGETQDNYAHTIGKQRDVDSPRINLTFRNTGSDQVQQRKKQLVYSNKQKTYRYAVGLVKSVHRAMNWIPGQQNSVSRFQPSTWETNSELASIIEDYSKTYQKFNESEKKLATHYYLEALFNTQSKSLKTKTAVSMIDHMQAFAPSTRGTGVSLLHPDVVSEYFNKFNKGLKSDRMQKQAEETASVVETQRGCSIK